MAVVAIIAARNVIDIFACRDVAVVTGAATAEYLRVIYRKRRNPDSRVVAVFANIGRQRVGWSLASRRAAIVTIDAAAGDAGMIEIRG